MHFSVPSIAGHGYCGDLYKTIQWTIVLERKRPWEEEANGVVMLITNSKMRRNCTESFNQTKKMKSKNEDESQSRQYSSRSYSPGKSLIKPQERP